MVLSHTTFVMVMLNIVGFLTRYKESYFRRIKEITTEIQLFHLKKKTSRCHPGFAMQSCKICDSLHIIIDDVLESLTQTELEDKIPIKGVDVQGKGKKCIGKKRRCKVRMSTISSILGWREDCSK